MIDIVWGAVVAVAIFVLAYFQGKKTGTRSTKKEVAKKILDNNLKEAKKEYEEESNMSPDQLVDAMLKWVRQRRHDTHPEQ
jgi:hypothetical protein